MDCIFTGESDAHDGSSKESPTEEKPKPKLKIPGILKNKNKNKKQEDPPGILNRFSSTNNIFYLIAIITIKEHR